MQCFLFFFTNLFTCLVLSCLSATFHSPHFAVHWTHALLYIGPEEKKKKKKKDDGLIFCHFNRFGMCWVQSISSRTTEKSVACPISSLSWRTISKIEWKKKCGFSFNLSLKEILIYNLCAWRWWWAWCEMQMDFLSRSASLL